MAKSRSIGCKVLVHLHTLICEGVIQPRQPLVDTNVYSIFWSRFELNHIMKLILMIFSQSNLFIFNSKLQSSDANMGKTSKQ
jgi:hypothetical protein